MKKLFPRSVLAISLGLAVSLGLAACQQDPQSTLSQDMPTTSTSASPAHPALAFCQSVTTTVKKVTSTSRSVAVMDSDGANATSVYTVTSGNQPKSAMWSYDGSSVYFVDCNSTGTSFALRSVPVTLVNGTPTGGTVTTIYTYSPSSDSGIVYNAAPCATSSTSKLAYSVGSSYHLWGALYSVSTGGGTPTLLYQTGRRSGYQREVQSVSWSPDDSRLAFHVRTAVAGQISTERDTIFIMDMSTLSIVDTIALTDGHSVQGMDWSRSGSNKLAFGDVESNGRVLKYYDATNKSIANGASGFYLPTWSPNNATLLGRNSLSGSVFYKTSNGSSSSSSTTISTSSIDAGLVQLNWKR